jgi:hypothetical protein
VRREETPLLVLRWAWKRASAEEREQFLAEIVKELEQRPAAPREQRLAQFLYPSPARRK